MDTVASFKLLCAVAVTDGKLDPAEKECLLAYAKAHEIPTAEAQALLQAVAKGGGVAVEKPEDVKDRQALFDALLEVATADKRLRPKEKALLHKIGEKLEIPAGYIEAAFKAFLLGATPEKNEDAEPVAKEPPRAPRRVTIPYFTWSIGHEVKGCSGLLADGLATFGLMTFLMGVLICLMSLGSAGSDALLPGLVTLGVGVALFLPHIIARGRYNRTVRRGRAVLAEIKGGRDVPPPSFLFLLVFAGPVLALSAFAVPRTSREEVQYTYSDGGARGEGLFRRPIGDARYSRGTKFWVFVDPTKPSRSYPAPAHLS